METAMTAAANIEIFLASLGAGALLAWSALRGAFVLIEKAGAGAGRHFTVRPAAPTGAVALARAQALPRAKQAHLR